MTTSIDTTPSTWVRLWHTTRKSLLLMVCWSLISATAAGAASDFVILGDQGVWVREGSTVVSGDVGANVASAGPWLASQQEMTIGENVVVQDATSQVMGDTMRLKVGSHVHDVSVNTLLGPGLIQGTTTTPVALPLVTLPTIPPVTPGTPDHIVPNGGTLTLDAGSYDLVRALPNATIFLSGGTYHIRELNLRNTAKLYALAPVDVRIQDHLNGREGVEVGPAPAATTLTAADVVITAVGGNGTTGAITATPAAARFGVGSTVRANVYAPNGSVRVWGSGTITGAFVGKWVRIDAGSTITLEGGFGLGSGGGNTPPVAEAGPDQTVQVTDTVQLDGSDSTDVDGDVLTYSWMLGTAPPGSTASLDDATSVMPTFVAEAPGSYEIELVVNDGTVNSASDTVTITTINSPPVADAGPDETVFVTQTVFLDGTNSSDVDQDPLTFQWTLTASPSGSTATLSDPSSPTPDFTVDLPGVYSIQLVVNDGSEDSDPDVVVIDTQNSKPVAVAEPDQTVPVGSTVLLDGNNSNDVDGDPLTYLWALIAMPMNSTAVLSDAMLVAPTFVADLAGIYVVQLIVNDGNEDSDPATVTITTANTPPVAEAGPDQTVPVGTTVQLDGSASSDLEGAPLTYAWVLTSQPGGSAATLSNDTLVTPTFVADVPGSYVVTLIVNDGRDDSAPATVLITTENQVPVADAGPDQTVVLGATVQLDGNGSADPDSDPLTYHWTLISTPVGSAATFSNDTLVTPTFVADLAGAYVIQLIANDGTEDSAPDTVVITATNPPPTLNPIGNQTVVLGQTLTLTLSGSDPNGDPLSFGATTAPLPNNMTLNGTTGELIFHPDGTQVGAHVLNFFVSDGLSRAEETITITVQGPGPGGSTAIQGRILDTNAFVNSSTEVPVVGATVSFLGTGLSTTSDAQGFFTLSGLPAGIQVLNIDARTAQAGPGGVTYASFREQLPLIANVTNVHNRPFYLPQLDPNSGMTVNGSTVTQVDPNNITVVSNPVLGVSLTVPPHTAFLDGQEYTGALSISEVPDALAPAALPDTLQPGLLITIQPPGVTFATSTAITFPNVDALEAGTEANIWSLDPLKGRFVIVGVLEVSPDGATLTTKSGGIKNTDWICPCPPATNGGLTGGGGRAGNGGGNGGGIGGGANNGDDPNNQPDKPNPDNDNPDEDCGGTGSTTSFCGGALTVQHQLPTYQSVGAVRGSNFIYTHSHADPHPILFNNPTIPFFAAMPPLMSAQLEIGGINQGPAVFTNTGAVTGRTGDYTLRQAVQFDAQNLTTGNYPYRLRLTNHYLQSAIGTVVQDTVMVRNERDSPFGAGWTLDGLDRLHPQANGDAVVSLGNGGQLLFRNLLPGTFTEIQNTEMPSGIIFPRKPILGDFNEDGHLDTAIPGQFGLNGRWTIYLGQGDASLVFDNLAWGGARPDAVNSGDFNEDGHVDLIAASEFSAGVIINFGRGDGTFGDAVGTPDGVNWSETALPLSQPNSLVVEDFNGDGHLDIASADGGLDKLIVVGHGDGLGNFTLLPSIALGGREPEDLASADVNLDGVPDLVSANLTSISLLVGDGVGDYGPPIHIDGPFGALLTKLTTGDFNQDGYADVAAGGAFSGGRILTFENNRLGGFYSPQSFFLPLGSNHVALVAEDVTADGLTDLIMATPGNGGSFTVVPGLGASEFGSARVFPVIGSASVVAVGDLNASGNPEVLVSSNSLSGSGYRFLTFLNEDLNDGFLTPPGDFSTLTQNPDNSYSRRLKNGTTIEFDTQGLQTSVTDRNNNVTTYQYDAQNRLETMIDPANLETTFEYGGAHLTKITDPAGRDTLFEINTDGDLITITDPDLSTRGFTYDPRHRLVQQESKRGFFTQYEYNFAGRHVKATRPDTSTRLVSPSEIIGVVDPASGLGTETNPAPVIQPTEVVGTFTDGKGQVASVKTDRFGKGTVRIDALLRTTTISRNFNGDPVVTTNPNQAITRRTYDDQGNVLTLTEAEGLPEERMTSFEYDPTFNLLTKITDPANKVTTIVRDPANGNPLQVINPLLDERVRTFTAEGLVQTDEDENDETTQFFYDPVTKNLDRIIDAETHTTRFVRDAAGNVTSLIEGEGTPEQRTRLFTYDTMNRLTSATDGTTNLPTQFAYDDAGNLTITTLPTNEQEMRMYDPMNRVAAINDPLRGLTTFLYDLNGQLEQTVNAAGDATTFAYDVAQQLDTIADALTGVQDFDYDEEGNVQTFTDARQKTTTFLYDKLNRQTARSSHGGTFTTTFTYDTRDNLIDTVDPKTQLIHRDYDDLSRLTDLTTPDNAIGIGYDKVGNPTDVADADSQVTFTYDGLNRIETAETSQASGLQPNVLLTSVYDAVGNRTQLDEANAASVTTYRYDLAGRLTRLIPPPGAAMQVTLGYDPAGRLASLAYPNGVTTAYGYDTKGRLDSLSHTLGTNPSFAALGYTYNPVGNILDILDQVNPSETRSHTYDALQRLKTGGTVGSTESYNYDLVGNRTTSFLSSSHTHDDLNRLTEDDQFLYTYDNNGNLETKTNKVTPTEVTTYHWDAQDQLIQIDRPDSATVTYKYDGLGRRIEKTVAGTMTRYVYDGEDIVLEYDGGANTVVAEYFHGDQVDQPLILQKPGLGFFYYHSNHQGSITHLTDNSGAVANSYVYDSYGRRSNVIESVIQPYAYTGREFDVESGLYFYRARYFDATTGRFLAEDPIGFDGRDQNLYRYVFNNPINLVDPDGTFPDGPSTSGPVMTQGDPGGGGGGGIPPRLVDGPGGTMSPILPNPARGMTRGDVLPQTANRIANQARARGLMDRKERENNGSGSDCPPNPQPPTNPFVGDVDPNSIPSLDELFGPPQNF